MADRYLYHLGSNTAPYETPATAATSLDVLLAGTTIAAGETIWVHSGHVDPNNDNQYYQSPDAASPTSPQRLISVDNFTDMNLLAGATIRPPSGGRNRVFNGNWYLRGINYGTAPTRANFGGINCSAIGTKIGNARIVDCILYTGSSAGSSHDFGATDSTGMIRVEGGTFLPRNTGATLKLGGSRKRFDGLVVDDTQQIPTSLFTAIANATGETEVMNCDFSDIAISNLVALEPEATQSIKFINCRLPTGATVVASWPSVGSQVYLINCDSGNTNYRWELHQYQGTIKLEPLVYATTSPALYEGTLPYSLRMQTNASSSRYLPLQSEWIHKWHDAGTHTLDVECLVGADGADALKTCELYLEVDYISGASSPLGNRATTTCSILAIGTDNPAGSTAWTGDGYAVERTHKLSATVTTTKNGYIRYRVCVAKPSTTVYFNPV